MATQVLGWCSNHDDSVEAEADQELGFLAVMGGPSAVSHPLFAGANVVGRRVDEQALASTCPDIGISSDSWKEIFLEDLSVSAKHAVIYIESEGEDMFVKDLKSRNWTFLWRKGKFKPLTSDRWAIESGDVVRFGAVECKVSLRSLPSEAVEGSPWRRERNEHLPDFAATQLWNADGAEPQESMALEQQGRPNPSSLPSALQEHIKPPSAAQNAAEPPLQQASISDQPNLTGDETTDEDDEAPPVPHDATQIQGHPAEHAPESAAETQQQAETRSGVAAPRVHPASQSARVLRDVLGTPDSADNDSEWQPELSGNHEGAAEEAQIGAQPQPQPQPQEPAEVSSPPPGLQDKARTPAVSSGWHKRARPRQSPSDGGSSWDLQASHTTSGPDSGAKGPQLGLSVDSKRLPEPVAAAGLGEAPAPAAREHASQGADQRRVEPAHPRRQVQRNLMVSSQAFGTQAVEGAMSDIGHLTAMIPDTQQMAQLAAPLRNSSQATTKPKQAIAKDLPEPAARERSAKAEASSHAAQVASPGKAGGVPQIAEQEMGIHISSPGPEAGPTSPGEMTQLAAGVLGSMAGDTHLLLEPVPGGGPLLGRGRGRGKQTHGRGFGHKAAAALSTDPYAFQESGPQRSGSADVASGASDSSTDFEAGKRGKGRRGGAGRARGRARRQPGARAAAKSRLSKPGAADVAPAPAEPPAGAASGQAELVRGKRKRHQTRKAADMATLVGMLSDEDAGRQATPEQQQHPPAKRARRGQARGQPNPSMPLSTGVPTEGPEQPPVDAMPDMQAASDPHDQPAAGLSTPGKHGWGTRRRRSRYVTADGQLPSASGTLAAPQTSAPADRPPASAPSEHDEISCKGPAEEKTLPSPLAEPPETQPENKTADDSQQFRSKDETLLPPAENIASASGPATASKDGTDEIPDTPAATIHDPAEPSMLGKRSSPDDSSQQDRTATPGSPSGRPRKMVKLSKRPGIGRHPAVVGHATQHREAPGQAPPASEAAAGSKSPSKQQQQQPGCSPCNAAPPEQAADEGLAGKSKLARQAATAQPGKLEVRALQHSAEPPDAASTPADGLPEAVAAADGQEDAACDETSVKLTAAGEETVSTPADHLIPAALANQMRSQRSGASARSKSSRGRKAAKESRGTKETANAVTPGPSRDLRKIDQRDVRVLFSTTISESLRSSLVRVLKRLGGKDAGKQATDFTHFVTIQPGPRERDLGFKKSFSTLLALAAGRPIVGTTWLEASGQAGSFVDPLNHLLRDDAAEKRLSFNLATSYERAQHRLLLADKQVLLSPRLISAEKDKGEGLRALVTAAGGSIAKALSECPSDQAANWLVIGSDVAADKDRNWCHSKLGSLCAFLTRASFTDCIMQQSLEGLLSK
ncbi:hypothetical protein WJX74_000543 [Apatococcus lobatus]|uniref:Mediator of DNA damage checkpoint protein 1 n=1 Tax=Apatococcus lobatus TaxID=904363 RepID=A0AAW1RI06_9CHLO